MREDSHRVNRAGQYLQRHLGGRSKPASREKLELGVDVAIVVAIVGVGFHGPQPYLSVWNLPREWFDGFDEEVCCTYYMYKNPRTITRTDTSNT